MATVSQEVTSVTAGMIVEIGATKVIVSSRHVRLVGAGMHWPKNWGILDGPSTKLVERTPMQTVLKGSFVILNIIYQHPFSHKNLRDQKW